MNRAHEHLSRAVEEALRSLGVASPRVVLETPRDPAHGDIATNAAMVHAKELGKPPRAVAEAVMGGIALDPHLVEFRGIAGPGFINFGFSPVFLRGIALDALARQEQFGETTDLRGKQILIEFVSANPSGPLNVVSARAASVGDSLIRMLRSRGARADAEFYVNDAGNQIRLLGESVLARYREHFGVESAIPEGGYHGEYIVNFAAQVKSEYGSRFIEQDAGQAAAELGRLAVDHFVGRQRRALETFRVEFDNWFRESRIRESKAEQRALEILEHRGTTYRKDDAVYLKTSEFGDSQDWVIMTRDGRPTYFLPDIAYHLDKYERGYDHIVDILGPDHHSFIAKMKAALRALGRDADKLEVTLLQHVTLLRGGEPVKMSKRAGQLIEMEELIDEVGVDSARYFFLLRRTSTPLDFDIELAKKQSDDNPVYYVQYAHARIESIFRKSGRDYPDASANVNSLQATEELDLLRMLRELPDVIRQCSDDRDPHGMTEWLREAATRFHKFYHNCRVLTEPAALQEARLALCRATQIALARGLSLCGVSAPKEM